MQTEPQASLLGPRPLLTLYTRAGDDYHEAAAEDIIQTAQRLLTDRVHPRQPMFSPQELEDFLRLQLAPNHRTTFAALLLDRRLRLIAFVELFQGTVDHVHVPLREVLRELFRHNAEVAIFARSEPSGDAEPSADDMAHYHQLRDGLAIMDIRVLDYYRVTGRAVISVARQRPRAERPLSP
jgi:DNA repair protein RadC